MASTRRWALEGDEEYNKIALEIYVSLPENVGKMFIGRAYIFEHQHTINMSKFHKAMVDNFETLM
jgi:hypothetical protein